MSGCPSCGTTASIGKTRSPCTPATSPSTIPTTRPRAPPARLRTRRSGRYSFPARRNDCAEEKRSRAASLFETSTPLYSLLCLWHFSQEQNVIEVTFGSLCFHAVRVYTKTVQRAICCRSHFKLQQPSQSGRLAPVI